MSENKLIAKNTFFLYVRMILTLGISLYTSRVILEVLGINDYGVYSVIGGVVSFFGFLNGAMSSATQRFLSFDIGNNDFKNLKSTFNSVINIHLLIAIIIVIIAETFGVWLINNQLNIAESRIYAANIVFQLSVATFAISVMQVPFDALIIAREKMNFYAILSIVEVLLKLLILYLIAMFNFDYLIFYSFLILIITFVILVFKKGYCKIKFEESNYAFFYDKDIYSKLISYSAWNLFGNIAVVARSQGINVILNLFFGTVINAAYGITIQVQSAVSLFVNNFQLALNPQIIKSYAQDNYLRFKELVLQGAKFSFFLIFIIYCPVVLNLDFILTKWLKNPPEFTNTFVGLALINLLIDCVSGTLMTGLQATGKIKLYQAIVGILIIFNLPISYILLLKFKEPQMVFWVSITISLVALYLRLYFVKAYTKIGFYDFFNKVMVPVLQIISFGVAIIFILNHYFQKTLTWTDFIFKSIIISVVMLTIVYLVGFTKNEKDTVQSLIKSKLLKK